MSRRRKCSVLEHEQEPVDDLLLFLEDELECPTDPDAECGAVRKKIKIVDEPAKPEPSKPESKNVDALASNAATAHSSNSKLELTLEEVQQRMNKIWPGYSQEEKEKDMPAIHQEGKREGDQSDQQKDSKEDGEREEDECDNQKDSKATAQLLLQEQQIYGLLVEIQLYGVKDPLRPSIFKKILKHTSAVSDRYRRLIVLCKASKRMPVFSLMEWHDISMELHESYFHLFVSYLIDATNLMDLISLDSLLAFETTVGDHQQSFDWVSALTNVWLHKRSEPLSTEECQTMCAMRSKWIHIALAFWLPESNLPVDAFIHLCKTLQDNGITAYSSTCGNLFSKLTGQCLSFRVQNLLSLSNEWITRRFLPFLHINDPDLKRLFEGKRSVTIDMIQSFRARFPQHLWLIEKEDQCYQASKEGGMMNLIRINGQVVNVHDSGTSEARWYCTRHMKRQCGTCEEHSISIRHNVLYGYSIELSGEIHSVRPVPRSSFVSVHFGVLTGHKAIVVQSATPLPMEKRCRACYHPKRIRGVWSPCGHSFFCPVCAEQWIKQQGKSTCPVCRKVGLHLPREMVDPLVNVFECSEDDENDLARYRQSVSIQNTFLSRIRSELHV